MRTALTTFALLGSALLSSAAPTSDARRNLKIVKTETNKFGQVIDWVEKSSQGDIADEPALPDGVALQTRSMHELFEVTDGPEGTVPMLRANASHTPAMKKLPVTEDDESQGGAKLDTRAGAQGKHWYASTAQSVFNYGGLATFSLFDAYVQSSGDFSLLQTAIIYPNAAHAGSGTVSSQTVEAGWINYPNQVQQPHLFAFFNTNGYAGYGDNISGWNLDYAGFVQTDSHYYPGQPLQPLSVIGGSQNEIRIGFVFNGNWWLYVGDRFIGYYPGSLFSQGVDPAQTLAKGAKSLNFYGEIYNSETSVTTTDMGSGEFPEAGYLKTAYIHNINYVNPANQAINYDGSRGQVVSDSNRYRQILHMNSGGSFGSWMDLGGPGAGGVVNG